MIQVVELTHSEKHHVNMGDYEWAELEASVQVIGTEGESTEALSAFAQTFVKQHLEPDLRRAIESSSLADTYAETWLDGPPPPKRTPRRTTR